MIADTVQNNDVDLQTNNCCIESILKYNILPVPLAIFLFLSSCFSRNATNSLKEGP